MYVKPKPIIAKLNNPFNSIHKDYFQQFPLTWRTKAHSVTLELPWSAWIYHLIAFTNRTHARLYNVWPKHMHIRSSTDSVVHKLLLAPHWCFLMWLYHYKQVYTVFYFQISGFFFKICKSNRCCLLSQHLRMDRGWYMVLGPNGKSAMEPHYCSHDAFIIVALHVASMNLTLPVMGHFSAAEKYDCFPLIILGNLCVYYCYEGRGISSLQNRQGLLHSWWLPPPPTFHLLDRAPVHKVRE